MKERRIRSAFAVPASHGSRQGWTRSLRRARRAIDASVRRIEGSCRVIDAAQRFASRRPLRATDHLQQVSGWLVDAAVQLQRAGIRMRDTTECAALAPERAAAAPQGLIDATARWLAAAGRLAVASDRLDDTMARLLRSAKEGSPVDDRPVIPLRRPPSPRWFLQYCPSQPADRIRLLLKRRRRPAPSAVTEAHRRVSRGRAPPSL